MCGLPQPQSNTHRACKEEGLPRGDFVYCLCVFQTEVRWTLLMRMSPSFSDLRLKFLTALTFVVLVIR